jgi:hypothetical protein
MSKKYSPEIFQLKKSVWFLISSTDRLAQRLWFDDLNSVYNISMVKAKAVPLHTTKSLGREDI